MTAAVEVLPWLPQGWLDGIAAGDYVERPRGDIKDSKEAWRFVKKRSESKNDPCKVMQRALDTGLANLHESDSGAAHDELYNRVREVTLLGCIEGHAGVWVALRAIRKAFIHETSVRRRAASMKGEATGTIRSRDGAQLEWQRQFLGAVQLIKGELDELKRDYGVEGTAACGCWVEPEGVVAGEAGDPAGYDQDDDGNGVHLVDLANGNLVWLDDRKVWSSYQPDNGLWRWDGADHGGRLARLVVARVRSAIKQKREASKSASDEPGSNGFSDREALESQVKMLQFNLKRLASISGARAMLDQAKFHEQMVDTSANFDTNIRLLHMPDGQVIELRKDGIHVRQATREDRGTRSTATPYLPGAKSAKWEEYLDTFLPSDELRRYVQLLFGYSLLGQNEKRKFVLLHGPSSTGKSTILEAVGASLGQYSGPFPANMLKGKSEESGRPDLLAAMTRRMIYASELSQGQHLHGDVIKSLTGGDKVAARLFRANEYQEQLPAFTPFIATNAFPRINGAERALLDRRLIAVPFDREMELSKERAEANSELSHDPDSQQAILHWLIEGWKRYCVNPNSLDEMPAVVVARTLKAKGAVSEEHEWFYNSIERDPNSYIVSNQIWPRYESYTRAESGNLGDMTKAKFNRWITEQTGIEPTRKKVKGKNEYVRWGLRWSMNLEEETE